MPPLEWPDRTGLWDMKDRKTQTQPSWQGAHYAIAIALLGALVLAVAITGGGAEAVALN